MILDIVDSFDTVTVIKASVNDGLGQSRHPCTTEAIYGH
jgi:hypothetical protein